MRQLQNFVQRKPTFEAERKKLTTYFVTLSVGIVEKRVKKLLFDLRLQLMALSERSRVKEEKVRKRRQRTRVRNERKKLQENCCSRESFLFVRNRAQKLIWKFSFFASASTFVSLALSRIDVLIIFNSYASSQSARKSFRRFPPSFAVAELYLLEQNAGNEKVVPKSLDEINLAQSLCNDRKRSVRYGTDAEGLFIAIYDWGRMQPRSRIRSRTTQGGNKDNVRLDFGNYRRTNSIHHLLRRI